MKTGPMSDETKDKISAAKTGLHPRWEGEYPSMKRPKVDCPICGKSCANAGSLWRHMKVH